MNPSRSCSVVRFVFGIRTSLLFVLVLATHAGCIRPYDDIMGSAGDTTAASEVDYLTGRTDGTGWPHHDQAPINDAESDDVARVGDVLAAPDVLAETSASHIPSNQLVEDLCEQFSAAEKDGCSDITCGSDCMSECVEQAEKELDFFKTLLCASMSEESFCAGMQVCAGDYDVPASCLDICPALEGCGALDSEMFGYGLYDCKYSCAAGLLQEGVEEILDCLSDALIKCEGSAFFSCFEPMYDPCEAVFCGEGIAPNCTLVPDPYSSKNQCLATCSDWMPGQLVGVNACLAMLESLPVECHDALHNCHQIPSQLPTGAISYCQALSAKCPSLQWGIPKMGDLSDEICAWQMLGTVQATPDWYTGFGPGKACVNALSQCPTGDIGPLYCLFDVPQKAKDACATALDLCSPVAFATEIQMNCEIMMTYANKLGFADMFAACLGAAQTCEALDECISE